MRFLKTDGSNEVVEFQAAPFPPYVILSHTWGRPDEEVTLQEIIRDPEKAENKPGFTKIRQFCAKAREDQFEYAWIDTCCIDKTSSAELLEAINSMYKWYQGAGICYAYLADVPTAFCVVEFGKGIGFDEDSIFCRSRWFRRGWTLQELIAPGVVEFYAADWTEIGTKFSLAKELNKITGINTRVLEGFSLLSRYNVAERMSWAANRTTTRPEDAAYSLLGIFGVNMPLLYGEGKRAFLRLQEEILKTQVDYTILAWNIVWPTMDEQGGMVRGVDTSLHQAATDIQTKSARRMISGRGLLASDPSAFTLTDEVKYSELEFAVGQWETAPAVVTSRSLQASFLLWELNPTTALAYLFCKFRGRIVCIGLTKNNKSDRGYCRRWPSSGAYYFLPADSLVKFRLRLVYIASEDLGVMLSHITEDQFSDPNSLVVNAPGVEFFCGWCPVIDGSLTNKVPEFQQFPGIVRCLYNGKDPFIVILERRGCDVISCNDPRLVSSVGNLFSNSSWDTDNLKRAKEYFSMFPPDAGWDYTRKDRVIRQLDRFTVCVAYKALGGGMSREIRLKLLARPGK